MSPFSAHVAELGGKACVCLDCQSLAVAHCSYCNNPIPNVEEVGQDIWCSPDCQKAWGREQRDDERPLYDEREASEAEPLL